MRENQTPLKDQARPPKLANRISRKNIAKKSLFSSVSEDEPVEISKHSVDSSPISEVNQNGDVTEIRSPMLVVDPASDLVSLSASSQTLFPSDLTPSPEARVDKDELGHVSLSVSKSSEFDAPKFAFVEVEIVGNYLRQARSEVLNADVGTKSKKLLEALVEIVLEDFHTLPVKRDRDAEPLSAKTYLVITCVLLWILALAVLAFSSGARSNLSGPLPT